MYTFTQGSKENTLQFCITNKTRSAYTDGITVAVLFPQEN